MMKRKVLELSAEIVVPDSWEMMKAVESLEMELHKLRAVMELWNKHVGDYRNRWGIEWNIEFRQP